MQSVEEMVVVHGESKTGGKGKGEQRDGDGSTMSGDNIGSMQVEEA